MTLFELMKSKLQDDERILFCSFRGDPGADPKWWAKPLAVPERHDRMSNIYWTVASFTIGADDKWRRTKENFSGGVCLMIDDIGDGLGSKFSKESIAELVPTAMIETSPGNFQAIYVFDTPIRDQQVFNAMIDAFVEKKFMARDTGMKGVTRVFRPPYGINGKKKYEQNGHPWEVRLHDFSGNCYTKERIIEAFDLELRFPRRRTVAEEVMLATKPDRIKAFIAAYDALEMVKQVKHDVNGQPKFRMDGWIDIHCPWKSQHTDYSDNGAAISEPSEANDWYGGFRCHHGHCEKKGWKDLTDWLVDGSSGICGQDDLDGLATYLDRINNKACGGNDDRL